MKSPNFLIQFLLPVATMAIVAGFGPGRLTAGEPIQFSREKPRVAPAPTEPTRLSRELATPSRGLVPHNPLEGLSPTAPEVRSRDPRDERRRRSAANERKNWMFYDRGESEDRDEDEMGLRDYTLEKDDGTSDSIFAPKSNESRPGARPRPVSPFSRNSQPDPDETPRVQEPAKQAKPAGEETARNRSRGDHVSKDLDLHTLLSSGNAAEIDMAGRGEPASRNARSGDLPVTTRDGQERRPGDLAPGNPSLAAPKAGGFSDLFGSSSAVAPPRSAAAAQAPSSARFSDYNNSATRNAGAGFNPARPSFDAGVGRSFNNPGQNSQNSYSSGLNDPAGRPAYGAGSAFGPRPAPSSGPSQSTWERSRIPRP